MPLYFLTKLPYLLTNIYLLAKPTYPPITIPAYALADYGFQFMKL